MAWLSYKLKNLHWARWHSPSSSIICDVRWRLEAGFEWFCEAQDVAESVPPGWCHMQGLRTSGAGGQGLSPPRAPCFPTMSQIQPQPVAPVFWGDLGRTERGPKGSDRNNGGQATTTLTLGFSPLKSPFKSSPGALSLLSSLKSILKSVHYLDLQIILKLVPYIIFFGFFWQGNHVSTYAIEVFP